MDCSNTGNTNLTLVPCFVFCVGKGLQWTNPSYRKKLNCCLKGLFLQPAWTSALLTPASCSLVYRRFLLACITRCIFHECARKTHCFKHCYFLPVNKVLRPPHAFDVVTWVLVTIFRVRNRFCLGMGIVTRRSLI